MNKGTILSVTQEQVIVSCANAVAMGEIALQQGGSWAGQVIDDHRGKVTLRPLDNPKGLQSGEPVVFTGGQPFSRLDDLKGGEVIDPLGRQLDLETSSHWARAGTPKSDWGLGRLEKAFRPQWGETVILGGDESVGPARLVALATENSKPDWIVTVTQGGSRELQRQRRAVAQAGLSHRCVSLWCPLWKPAGLSALLPAALERIVSQPMRGHGLVFFDDLRRWLESLRQLGESHRNSLTPSGFLPETRSLLCRILDLPAIGENSFGVLVGWSFERLMPNLTVHPFGAVVELLANRGIILEGHDEGLRPAHESWGYQQGPLSCRDELIELSALVPPTVRHQLDELLNLINELFLTVTPENLGDWPNSDWTDEHTKGLQQVARSVAEGDSDMLGEVTVPRALFDHPDLAREKFLANLLKVNS